VTNRQDWTFEDLAGLPTAEDERHEYKSSATPDADLGNKVSRAASGFWNSGGGILVIGVNGGGKPDGGVTLAVGRQSRRDWIDQHIARVDPRGNYVVHEVKGLSIIAECGVFAIQFGNSEFGPHMAPDLRYYIRAGAHTVPATHFIVESIRARRGVTRPLVRAIIRRRPASQYVLQLGVVTLTETPAVDIALDVSPIPPFLKSSGVTFPIHIAVVQHNTPFFLDFHVPRMSDDPPLVAKVRLQFKDLLGAEYDETSEVDVERQLGSVSLGAVTDAQVVEQRLAAIEKAIGSVANALSKNEAHLKTLASRR